ncbi:MAG: hypothetical protein Q9191_002724 [Dirinaria sp. TL-2023a]
MAVCLLIMTLEQFKLQLSQVGVDRPLHGKNRAIAKAAAVSGFDCSDIERLMTLVNAVRNADAGSSYPDYYTGKSTRESDHLPARIRHRKSKPYRDWDSPAVPAFAMTHDQIVQGMRQFGPGGGGFMGYLGTHVVETSHQTINLYNKRSSGDNYWPAATKKLKTSASQPTPASHSTIIDLTQDDSPNQQGNNLTHHQAMANQSFLSERLLPSAQARASNRERETRLQTFKALDTISNVLSAQMAQIVNARERLRKRWDMDRNLQLQTVTDVLVDLNGKFGIMEDAGRDAVRLIKDRLRR